jgi:hypothetical protein
LWGGFISWADDGRVGIRYINKVTFGRELSRLDLQAAPVVHDDSRDSSRRLQASPAGAARETSPDPALLKYNEDIDRLIEEVCMK